MRPDAFCVLAYPALSVDPALDLACLCPTQLVSDLLWFQCVKVGQSKVSCKLGENSAAAAQPFV